MCFFLGRKSHETISRYLASSDIFVGPSIIAKDGDQEGLPVSFMEAMASGCPVITTDLPGNYDLITSYETGIIISQKNAKVISEAVVELIKDTTLQKKIIKGAKQKIEKSFSWQKIAQDYYKLFKYLIKKQGKYECFNHLL